MGLDPKTVWLTTLITIGMLCLLVMAIHVATGRASKLTAGIAIAALIAIFSAAGVGSVERKMGWLDPVKNGWGKTYEWIRKPFGGKP